MQSSRLGFLSEPSNSIIVAPTGVDSVVESPLVIGILDNGFGVISNPSCADITVYDYSGKEIKKCKNPNEGEKIILPNGIYVLTSSALQRPVKIVVL